MNRIGGKSNTGEGGEDEAATFPMRMAICAAARSAGSIGPLLALHPLHDSTPTICRSKSRRAPSREKADSCRAHKVDDFIAVYAIRSLE